MEDLDGDCAVVLLVVRAPDRREAAAADLRVEQVATTEQVAARRYRVCALPTAQGLQRAALLRGIDAAMVEVVDAA